MRQYTKLLLTAFFALVIFINASSQDYIDAVGIRAGESFGVSYKHFFGEKLAVEASVMSRWHGIYSMGLLEWHWQFMDLKGLNWYLGAGPSAGYWTANKDLKWLASGKTAFVGSITAIAGFEYNFKDVPLALGLDWKPSLNLIGYGKPWLDEFSLSLKFRLN
jgi:hypothetical protein